MSATNLEREVCKECEQRVDEVDAQGYCEECVDAREIWLDDRQSYDEAIKIR